MATAAQQNINTGDSQPAKRNPKHLTVRFATNVEHVSKVYPKEKHPNMLGAAERAAVAAATNAALLEARGFFDGPPRKATSLTTLATRAGLIDFASGGDSSKNRTDPVINKIGKNLE
jgi:hypothetical protein